MKDELEPSVFRPDRSGLQSVLGDLEAETMTAIWERPSGQAPTRSQSANVSGQGVSVREVHEILMQRRPIAYTTVMTTMARLAKKKLLKVKKVDHAYTYYPSMSQAEFTSSFVGRILDQLLANYSGAAISHFAEMANPESREAVQNLLLQIVQRRKTDKKETR